MQREEDNDRTLSTEELNDLESQRIERLDEAGIDEQKVLKCANEHLNTWTSYFGENITRGKDDVNFCLRDQWTAVERSEFSRLFKPAMTFNKLYDATKKISGEQRKNKPDLIVRSLTGKATQEQIDLRADLVRTISYQSQNDLVYQTAFRSALMMGFGAFQVCLDYESSKSFNRVIKYDIIPDSTMCSWDPTAIKPHKGDGNFCSRRFVFTREEFEATYPYVSNPISFVNPDMLMDFQWQTKDTVIVCDEFVKEWFPLIVYKVRINDKFEVMDEFEFEKAMEKFKLSLEIAGDSEVRKIIEKSRPIKVNERQTQDYKIMHYRMIRDHIIDFSEWPSRQLPIVFVDGDSYWIEGRQYTRSFIHEARDAQKCVNYFGSEIAAEIKNRRREQWIGTPDNIAGEEQLWRNPETQSGILIAKPDPKTGQMPQKMPPWELSQGLVQNFQRASQDIREILGFSENEQLQGRDISGTARRERKLEGSMSAYVFFDNLNQAVEQAGRLVNDLLPAVVGDDERHMVISKADGKTKSIIMNEMQRDGTVRNELEKGDFDVEISSGPSFAVQKEVALEFFQQTIANNPQVFNLIADLWAGNLDIQQMDTVKERLKTLVPPDIIAKEEGTEPPPKQPDPQMMMMQQEMQLKQAQIQEAQAAIQIKAQELQLKKEKNQLDQAELMLKAHKIQADNQLNVYDHQANIEKSRITHDLDHKRVNNDFDATIASIIADLHKHQNPHKKETNPTGGASQT